MAVEENLKGRSKGYRYYVLLLLTLVYAFNFIDRQILGILAPYIQADLGLDDGQIGLLAGFFFALFYTVVGIPIALLADRFNRVNIVAVSLAVWSGFTAVSGLAVNYLQLALARAGVGIGEAGGSPPSHSMISDLFSKEERGTALGIYSLGIPLGIMAAYFASAALLGQPNLDWRTVFIAVGLPGVVLAVILRLTVREPKRGAMDVADAAVPQQPLGKSIGQLLSVPSWWGMCFGISFSSFGAYALGAFIIIYLGRTFPEVPLPRVLVIFGILNGIAYAGGTFIGGIVADRWGRRTKAGYAWAPAVALLIGAPCLILAFWVQSFAMAMTLTAVYLFLSGFYLGPSFSIAQTLAPIRVRAMSTALFFFILNLVALGGGPTYVGWVSTMLTEAHGAEQALRLSMTSLAVPYAIGIIAFIWTGTRLPKDWERTQARNAGLDLAR
ncbi:spinster family MFS transporter [Aquisalinus flavus]|uniref:MFS transporter n=1 Tax=Aquisalinus flavus TaxID=1526572 RepID=A0A8J2Y6R2_9PROT|nr:MFS transporter [Aquisalinus flavus]MBD0426617.1 MFS transporter [Aquisalinus flavus]UNE47839.1 MFS transporter [Aquisalinus flavus]GGD06461.1 MFS transporter [Aquisalinus flavus]